MRNRMRALTCLGWLPLCLLAAPCLGQTTGPAIFFIYPAGGQLGKTVEATVAGQQLKGATAVWVSGKGLSVRVVPEEKPDPKPKPGPPAPLPRPWSALESDPPRAANSCPRLQSGSSERKSNPARPRRRG